MTTCLSRGIVHERVTSQCSSAPGRVLSSVGRLAPPALPSRSRNSTAAQAVRVCSDASCAYGCMARRWDHGSVLRAWLAFIAHTGRRQAASDIIVDGHFSTRLHVMMSPASAGAATSAAADRLRVPARQHRDKEEDRGATRSTTRHSERESKWKWMLRCCDESCSPGVCESEPD